ncbi:resolvase [Gottschalkia acidurici 9a]|uniref:Resolvase n=1 Tax=Gottschalkia acidurici (strain ATCC 7906 / DSM 604 / BCRC 14475 / CIP 104303 / KCTC 5404 / NCIMB 10678 / 9a) TaxID=1128398 RepID=K0AZJ4_GOTA9|nr:recombinase family protein [Gottschalkia acidurici]AFS79218.1 resolvase [Gottschalkia acidurici 9a]
MQYCIYLRKSRSDEEAEQRGEGETLARHEKILLDLARKLKLNITKIYKEVVSGETISSRPIMQQLLSEVEEKLWSGVLVVEVERLARGDTIDQGTVSQAFKYSNTKIITPVKTYDPNNEFDEEYFEFGLFMSRREYKTINRRLQRGRLESVKEGKYVGNTPPYGYVRKKLEKEKGYTLEPHPEQSDIVKLIYKLYTEENIGVSLIVRRLEELKIPTAKGGYWSTSTLRGILNNPVYIGKIRWKHRPQVKKVKDGEIIKERPRSNDVVIVDGLHEAIIDEETFNKAQEILSENSSVPVPTKYTIKNSLAGIVKCGKCGRNMNRRPYGERQPATLMCPVPQCSNVSSQLHLVEQKLLESLEKWLDKYKLKINSNTDNNNLSLELDVVKKSIQTINEELETLNTQSDKLHDLLEQGIYSTEKFLERSKIISEKISKLKDNKSNLEKELNQNRLKEESDRTIIPKIERILKTYNTLETPDQKNELLKEVLTEVEYNKEVGGRWHAKPDDFKLVVHPKIPK